MKSHLIERLQLLERVIVDICQISGVPGLSYGVLHHGETLHRANFGFRDVEAKLVPTSDTIYGIGSMSKAFTAAGMGVLVEDGKLSWNTSVRDVLPDFNSIVPNMNEQLTVLDLLSHRSGLAGSNDIWTGSNSVPLLDKSQTVPTFNYFGAVNLFRGQFQYNNWGYAMAGEVIEALSAQSWGTFLEQKLMKPLKMDRSFTTRSAFKNENDVAKPYGALDDASVFPLAEIQMEDGTIMAPAGAVRSTVNDMLKWSAALLSAYKDQLASGRGSTTGSPLKQVPLQLTGHIPMTAPYYLERTYGMGWVRTELPGSLGAVGCNGMFVKEMPIVGEGGPESLVIYHQGSMAGYTSSIFLLPESNSAVVVLTNSIQLNEAADWVGELLLEALLESPNPHDYKLLAKESADSFVAKFPAMIKELEEQRVQGTAAKPLQAYVGKYYNSIHNFFIEISLVNDSLYLTFQGGRDNQVWKMEHYHYDTFTWLMSRDEAIKHSRFPYAGKDLYKIEFKTSKDEKIGSLLWAHEVGWPHPEEFKREDGEATTTWHDLFQKPLKVL